MTTYWERLARRTRNTLKPVGNALVSGLKTVGNTVKNEVVNHGAQVAGDLAMGALLLKTGGRVPGKKNKAIKAIVHGGEFMLPVGVKPTKKQVEQVKKLKLKAKK
jgi:hypothetical protein